MAKYKRNFIKVFPSLLSLPCLPNCPASVFCPVLLGSKVNAFKKNPTRTLSSVQLFKILYSLQFSQQLPNYFSYHSKPPQLFIIQLHMYCRKNILAVKQKILKSCFKTCVIQNPLIIIPLVDLLFKGFIFFSKCLIALQNSLLTPDELYM